MIYGLAWEFVMACRDHIKARDLPMDRPSVHDASHAPGRIAHSRLAESPTGCAAMFRNADRRDEAISPSLDQRGCVGGYAELEIGHADMMASMTWIDPGYASLKDLVTNPWSGWTG